MCGDYWKGNNGSWYSRSWGGNQYTGARRLVIQATEKVVILSTVMDVLEVGVSIGQATTGALTGNRDMAITGLINAGYSTATAATGLYGDAFDIGYSVGGVISGTTIGQTVVDRIADGLCSVSGKC